MAALPVAQQRLGLDVRLLLPGLPQVLDAVQGARTVADIGAGSGVITLMMAERVGPKGRDYRRGKTIVIEKTTEPQFVEFVITDDPAKEQPRFDARVWE